MKAVTAAAALCATFATPAGAQERWETFVNDVTARQGAYICSEMDETTGDFFCVELACEAGAPLMVEISHAGSRLEETFEARFRVNGVDLGAHAFEQSAPGGYAHFQSLTAAQDDTLRYWLSAGRTAEIVIGNDVQPVTLAGSSVAMRQVLNACPIG